MRLGEARGVAAREPAGPISCLQGPPHARADLARLAPCVQDLAVTLHDRDDGRVAADPPGGLGSDRRAVLQLAALALVVLERREVDVDDGLVGLG